MRSRAGMLRTAKVKGIAERFAAKTIMWLVAFCIDEESLALSVCNGAALAICSGMG